MHGRVGAFVRRRVPSQAAADVVVQDVFLRLHVGVGDRAREKLRAVFDACCRFELDRRGGVVVCEPRKCGPRC